jgi:hypothetical protein
MNSTLTNYLIKYYGYLMSELEKRAYSHLAGTMKATKGRSDLHAQQEARRHESFSRLLCDDPDVLRLTAGGYESFAEQIAQRILAEHREKILLNLCPRCHELARTPEAQQCRFCGFDWHPVNQTTREN